MYGVTIAGFDYFNLFKHALYYFYFTVINSYLNTVISIKINYIQN